MSYTYNPVNGFIIVVTEGTVGSPISYEDIYQADLANGWGVMTKPATGIYNMTAHIQLGRNAAGTECHFDDNGDVLIFTEAGPGHHNQRFLVRNASGTTNFSGEKILGYEHTATTWLLWTVGTDVTYNNARLVAKYVNEFQVRLYQPSAARTMSFNLCMLGGVTPIGSPSIEKCILSGVQKLSALYIEDNPKPFQYTTITDTPDDNQVLQINGSYDTLFTPPGWDRSRWFVNIYEGLRIEDTNAKLFYSPYWDTFAEFQDAAFLDMAEVPNWDGEFPNYLIGEPPGVLEMYTFDPIVQYPDETMVTSGTFQAWDVDGVLRIDTTITDGRIDYNGYTEFPYADMKALRANRHYCDMDNGDTLHKNYNPYEVRIVTEGKSWTFYYSMVTKMDDWPIILFPSTSGQVGIEGQVVVKPADGNLDQQSISGDVSKRSLDGSVSSDSISGNVSDDSISGDVGCNN